MTEPRSVRPVWSEVDLGALAANVRELRRRLRPGVGLIGSIKANAYGHGAVPVACVLAAEGVDVLATGSFEEAVAVREAGVRTPILLFAGPLPEAMPDVLRHGFVPTVCDLETARAVSASARRAAPVWVKVDAGLGRIGVPLGDAPPFVRAVAALPNVSVDGLYTHLPFVDEAGREWAESGVRAFAALVDELAGAGIRPRTTQALSSAGILAGLEDPCGAVCPGHALYGLPAASPDVADASAFRPVLRAVKTRLIQVTRHSAPRRAGIGGAAELPAGAATGIVPFGRTDGYRGAQDGARAAVLVRGRRVPVRGVSLEHTTLDLTGVDAAGGDEVVVLGEQAGDTIPAAEIAGWQGASADDVVLAFDRRMPRVYLS